MPQIQHPTPAAVRKQRIAFFDVIRFAAGYWKRQPRRLALILCLFLSAALIETYLPTALSNFLATARQADNHAAIIRALLIFLGAYGGQTLLFSVAFIVYNSFETRVFKHLVDDAFTQVQRLPEQFFVNNFAGSIISRINRARQKIEAFEDHILIRLLPALVILVGSTYFLALRFPALAAVMVLYITVLMGVSIVFVFRISGPAQGIYADAQDNFIAHLADGIGGIATTKSYAQEPRETAHFYAMTERLRAKNLRAYHLANFAGIAQRFLLFGMLALLLGGGTLYLLQGKASVESIAYLAFAYNILQSYIRDLGDNIKNMLTASYDLHAVIALLREPPEQPHSLPPLDVRQGGIAFDRVTFTYPGKPAPVFENLSVVIRPGERVALVGHSGSGKTTFIRLLLGLYPVTAGVISLDGQDIAAASRTSLRSAIATVPQDPVLFHRSLAANIAYGKPEATPAAINAAAEQAYIADFIAGLPERYDTLVGERGIKLSGGERQRIAIARAILADRRILILDEATSSLDSASERAIQQALLSLTHGRTSIMIAHRLSTILDADRILVFDHGRIVEEGTHTQLLARPNGIYADLFRLQSGGFLQE